MSLTTRPFRTLLLTAALLPAALLPAFAGKQGRIPIGSLQTAIYTVEGDAFVRHNGDRYSNRPLYCNHIYAIVLAGDKPYCQVGNMSHILGNLMFALVRDGKGKWLQDASDITSKYRPGRMEWTIKDGDWGGTSVFVEALPAANGTGLVEHVRVDGAQPGDKLVWASGSARTEKSSILWTYDMTSLKTPYAHRGFVPDDCAGIKATANGSSWTLQAVEGNAPVANGACSAATQAMVADAGAWMDPTALTSSQASQSPVVCGSVDVTSGKDIYWSLVGPDADSKQAPADAFAAAMQRETGIENSVVINTPDPWLDAGMGACVNVVDACFREGIYSHSGMRWSTPLLGWRTIFGGTVVGSHDNVKTEAKLAIPHQIGIDSSVSYADKTQAHADDSKGLTSQAPDSRMFGKGRVDFHQPHHYDMQSQFFDQIQHAWRSTGDPELEKLLKPSLDLHCEYIKDCFDPAGLGIYESFANTWPTDDQWYNGGGTSEETAYAYRAEKTALQLAQRAGDQAGVKLHQAALDRIHDGFFNLLWTQSKGYPGAYREQYGLKRLHESGWLYAIFCPIDAGLLTTEQEAQALYYTEFALERDKMPYGGEQCWPSNWVPSIWSVREMWSGDDYQLALAYCQAGLPDDGWKVFRGMFPQQMLFGPVPGDMGHPAGGTDFNDCNSMFARYVVEGLFGYVPDYPDNVVKLAPQFPSDWDHASIKTPDFSLSYKRDGTTTTCQITVAHAAPLHIELPVATKGVDAVTVDGKPVKWKLTPGFGRSLVNLDLPSASSADIKVTTDDALKTSPATPLSGNSGEPATLQADDGKIVDFHDPQGVLDHGRISDGAIKGVWTTNSGDHEVFGLTKVGDTKQWRIFKVHVTDVKADQMMTDKTNLDVPAGAQFTPVDMTSLLNGDIRTIYQQQYVSPRPNTCSLRIGIDGYSSWQNYKPGNAPKIDLNKASSLLDPSGRLLAGKGVPFQFAADPKNIAFTSQWDNWPKTVEVPVNQKGNAVWFLICGTTNPMEVRIANAELRMKYADGVVEKLEITPPFNFWTLCPFAGNDYDYQRDGFSLPKVPPTMVQLGTNCRAVLLSWHLRPGVALQSVTLATLSNQVVVGLMGVTVMH
jgi:hypothetical protein